MAFISVSGADKVISDFNEMPTKLHVNAYTAIVVSANKIKASARANVGEHRHFPGYGATIQYEMTVNNPAMIEATIESKSPWGSVIEFEVPIPHMGPALWQNEADVLLGIDKAVEQASA